MRVLWKYFLFATYFQFHSFVKFYFQGTITYSKKKSNIESDGFLSWLHEFFLSLVELQTFQFYFKSLPMFSLLFCYIFHLQSICQFRHNLPHVAIVCFLPPIISNLSNTLVVEHIKGFWTWPCIVDVVDCKDFDLCCVCDRLKVTILWKILPYRAWKPRMKCRYILGVMPPSESWLTL
jgi:hypothetical protein